MPVYLEFGLYTQAMVTWKGSIGNYAINGYVRPYAFAELTAAGGVGGSFLGISFQAGLQGTLTLLGIAPYAVGNLTFNFQDPCKATLTANSAGHIWLNTMQGKLDAYVRGCAWILGCRRYAWTLWNWGGIQKNWQIWNKDLFNTEFESPMCGGF